jgi:YHS domain-containing protein
MEVGSESPYRTEHEGRVWLFCCASCQRQFADSPQAFPARRARAPLLTGLRWSLPLSLFLSVAALAIWTDARSLSARVLAVALVGLVLPVHAAVRARVVAARRSRPETRPACH